MFLIYLLVIMLIPLYAQMKVKNTYHKYSKVPSTTGYTGAEAARKILDANGLYNVAVEETRGVLSDHYDPISKTVRLSSNNYNGRSVAGVTIAAHEVGHAIQDENGYAFLRFRHAMVPVVNFTSKLSGVFVIIGLLATAATDMLRIGILLLAVGVLFQMVTLPVEFNASNRAIVQMRDLGLVGGGEEKQARSILNAAALTYVAATAVAVAELLRLVLIYTNRSRN